MNPSSRQDAATKLLADLLVSGTRGEGSPPQGINAQSLLHLSVIAAEATPPRPSSIEDSVWLRTMKAQHDVASARESNRPVAPPPVSVPSPVLEPSRDPTWGSMDNLDLGTSLAQPSKAPALRPHNFRKQGYHSAPLKVLTERKEYDAYKLWD